MTMLAEFWCLALGRPGDFSTAIHGPSLGPPAKVKSRTPQPAPNTNSKKQTLDL